jgi:hypothetical protein
MKSTQIIALIMLCFSIHMLATSMINTQEKAQTAQNIINNLEYLVNAKLAAIPSSEDNPAVGKMLAAIGIFRSAKQKFDAQVEHKENMHGDALFNDLNRAKNAVYYTYADIPF